jgi:hypothetical protein
VSGRATVSIAGGVSIWRSEAMPARSMWRICGMSLWSKEPTLPAGWLTVAVLFSFDSSQAEE